MLKLVQCRQLVWERLLLLLVVVVGDETVRVGRKLPVRKLLVVPVSVVVAVDVVVVVRSYFEDARKHSAGEAVGEFDVVVAFACVAEAVAGVVVGVVAGVVGGVVDVVVDVLVKTWGQGREQLVQEQPLEAPTVTLLSLG